MNAGSICTHAVAVVDGNTTVLDAARRMREDHVGDLVVVEEHAGRLVPVGILTDRDIVVGVVAYGLVLETATMAVDGITVRSKRFFACVLA